MPVMKPKIDFYISPRLWLHLEEYHNAGLTRDETKAIIESITVDGRNLCPESMGVNGNWIVNLPSSWYGAESEIEYIVCQITQGLDNLLLTKKFSGDLVSEDVW